MDNRLTESRHPGIAILFAAVTLVSALLLSACTSVAPQEPSETISNSIGIKLKYIPAGSFEMGSMGSETNRRDDEGPQRKVTISKPFFIGVYEVTQEQYEKVMGTNPSKRKGKGLPVEKVSWNEACEFCLKLTEMEKDMIYRLPTEAEWEYAARAGTETAYYWGDEFNGRYAWSLSNSGEKTRRVGTRQPNPWGLYDMGGNVWEWCQDWYSDAYPAVAEEIDPKGPDEGTHRTERGGAWNYDSHCCRSARRYKAAPDDQYKNLGLRVVAIPAAEQ